MIILLSTVALLVGLGVGFFLGKKSETLRSQQQISEIKKVCDERISTINSDFESRISFMRTEHDRAMQQMRDDQQQRRDGEISLLEKKFEESIGKVEAQMKNAADEMLRDRQKEFADSSNRNIGLIIDPLRQKIDNMKKAMTESTLSQTNISAQMKAGIESMMRVSESAMKSADELARVFRQGSKVQGDWGEAVLSELLESQGLTPGVHYDLQSSLRDATGNTVRTETGSTLRPDVILHLDSSRDVIIDSKVSMSAFIDYVNADDEPHRIAALNAHVESLRKHVRELASKDYSSYIQPPKVRMNYVIMFVPNTGALWTALRHQPDLWRKAMEKNVYIADEQTLFAALKIVSMTWTQIAQERNHEKVYALADEMLDRVGQFVKKHQALGKALDNARKAFDESDRKLQPQGQSILTTCAKLQKLGARQSERNPLPQIDVISETDEENLLS